MEAIAVLAATLVGFGLVAGRIGLAWLLHGRDPAFHDDPSILLAAPPPGMTAATATIVEGGPTPLAFMAALLDLASRDEIMFKQEPIGVGIAIHGSKTDDVRVLLNRRQPIGGGEEWLLTQLRTAALAESGVGAADVDWPDKIGDSVLGLIRAGSFALGDTDGPTAVSARSAGLMSAPAPDLTPATSDLLARVAGPVSVQALAGATSEANELARVMSDPAAMARDPDGYIRQLEAAQGKPLSEDSRDRIKDWAARYRARTVSAGPLYIQSERAMALRAPHMFRPLVEAYAARNGWVAGMPLWRRLKWQIIAIMEMVSSPLVLMVALAILLAFGLTWLAALGFTAGWLAGAILTYMAAPTMIATTTAGARMKAQLAAYRRTLQMTFGQVRSMDEVVASNRLVWLETPDQALVWGVALGLLPDIQGLLGRTAELLEHGGGTRTTFVPTWYESAPVAAAPGDRSAGPKLPGSVAQAGLMFAGIEAIGSAAR